MPHLGTQPPTGFKTTTKQSFSGDNSTVAFTLNRASSTATDLEIFVDNIQQEPTTAYSVSGTTLTFTEAPPTGTNNVYVVNRGGDQNGLLPPQDLGTTDYIFGDDISFNSDSAKLNFGADSEITVTHVADTGLNLKHTATGDDKPIVLTLQTGETDIAADDVIGKINFQAPDEGTGTDAILVAAGIQAISEGDFSSSVNATSLQFMTGASETATAKASITSGGDVKVLTDGASIFFGADSEIELRHVADDGLILKHVGTADGKEPSLTFQAGDNDIAANDVLGSIFFQAPDEGAGTDAILVAAGIEAVSEGDFSSSSNATSLVFKTGSSEAATEKARLDSSGNLSLGNGTATNDGAIHINAGNSAKNIVLEADRDSDGQGLGNIQWHSAGTNVAQISGERAASDASADMVFYTYANGGSLGQRMRIDDGGNIIFGGSTAPAINGTNADEKCVIESDGEFILQGAAKPIMYLNRNQNAGEIVSIRQGNTAVGGIDANSSSTDFNTSSDYRLKENVTTSWDATTRLKQLKPSRFSWKIDGKSEADTDGFLAHEVSSIVPQATRGTKDEVVTQDGINDGTYPKDAKVGDDYMQSIDHSKLVPLLTKSLQEALTRIDTLEAEVKTLKGE
nr:hypothetical protein [uncultured Mediterranean phage uvMED]